MSALSPIGRDDLLLQARSLIRALPDPAYIKRSDGRYADCNEAWCRVSGLSRENLLTRRDGDLFPEAVSEVLAKNDETFWKSGTTGEVQEVLKFANGETFSAKTSRMVLYGPQGRIFGFIAICRPHSEKFTPLDSAEGREKLADKKTPKADPSVIDFADSFAALVEEMHLPLNSISGFASMLTESKGLDFEQTDHVEGIASTTRGLLLSLQGVHELARLARGSLTVEKVRFDLRELVRDVVQQFLSRIMEKKLTISYRVDEKVPEWVWADRAKVRKIMVNLLSNATRFTEQGNISVALRTLETKESDAESSHLLQFSVTDTGVGVPADEVEKLFKPFHRIPTENGDRGGHGVGLALVRAYSQVMGGSARLESELGQGTTAYASFGVSRIKKLILMPGESDEPEGLEGLNELAEAKGEPLRVIMAEDMPSSQKLSQHLFRKLGHDLTIVGDGKQLLAALRTIKFDAAIVDIQMPVMDGFEVVDRIRKGEAGDANRNLFISAVTAAVTDTVKNRCLQLGVNWFLEKPLLSRKLEEVLERIRTVARD